MVQIQKYNIASMKSQLSARKQWTGNQDQDMKECLFWSESCQRTSQPGVVVHKICYYLILGTGMVCKCLRLRTNEVRHKCNAGVKTQESGSKKRWKATERWFWWMRCSQVYRLDMMQETDVFSIFAGSLCPFLFHFLVKLCLLAALLQLCSLDYQEAKAFVYGLWNLSIFVSAKEIWGYPFSKEKKVMCWFTFRIWIL